LIFGNSCLRRRKKTKTYTWCSKIYVRFLFVFFCIYIVPKDGEKYIKKEKKNTVLCIWFFEEDFLLWKSRQKDKFKFGNVETKLFWDFQLPKLEKNDKYCQISIFWF
jgi:hypothetical protein